LLKEPNKKILILMNTGQSSDIPTHNIEIPSIRLEKIDVVFLSHGPE